MALVRKPPLLRTDEAGFDLRARVGGYARGDGEEATLEGNTGFTLGSAGFLNISGQVSDSAPTSRSEPYAIRGDALGCRFSEKPKADRVGQLC